MSKHSHFEQIIVCDTQAEFVEAEAEVNAYIIKYPNVTKTSDAQTRTITLTFPTETVE